MSVMHVVNAFFGDKLIIVSSVASSIEYYDDKLNTLKGQYIFVGNSCTTVLCWIMSFGCCHFFKRPLTDDNLTYMPASLVAGPVCCGTSISIVMNDHLFTNLVLVTLENQETPVIGIRIYVL